MKTTLKTLVTASALATWAAIFMMAVGCQKPEKGPVRVQGGTGTYEYLDYGNGVLYFRGDGAKFGRAFSAWRAEHPKWIIIAIAPDNQGTYGSNNGYYVIANPDL